VVVVWMMVGNALISVFDVIIIVLFMVILGW